MRLPLRLVAALCAIALTCAAAAHAQQFPTATPESVGMSSPRLARLAAALNEDIGRGQMPGAVIAIARRGKLVYYEAFGFLDKAKGLAMPKDAIFSIASMTKPVVAAAALTYYEENRLLLHEPIGTYLPALNDRTVAVFRRDGSGVETFDREPARRQPTIQDLMRHTAGFTYGNQGTTALHKAYPGGSGNVAETMTGAEFIGALAKLPLHYQPGTRWDYSYGLDIVGVALEQVARQPLGRVLQERIFAPLAMKDTAFVVPREKAARIAKALPTDPITGRPQAIRDQTLPWKFECGGGCLTSTALDYLRFAQMLLDRGVLEGTRVLGRKTVEFMTADHLGPDVDATRLHAFPVEHIDGYGFGLGVAVRRVPGVAGIMGSPGDFRWSGAQGTLFWVDPKEALAVVYMAQTPGAIRAHYREVIAALVQQAIVD
jgi:CubicO group peptidase (beta-lactamase class C family)